MHLLYIHVCTCTKVAIHALSHTHTHTHTHTRTHTHTHTHPVHTCRTYVVRPLCPQWLKCMEELEWTGSLVHYVHVHACIYLHVNVQGMYIRMYMYVHVHACITLINCFTIISKYGGVEYWLHYIFLIFSLLPGLGGVCGV